MATSSNSRNRSNRDTPKVINFFQINGRTFSLGDLRKNEFSTIEDPKASVKSIQAWAINVSNILRGFAKDTE